MTIWQRWRQTAIHNKALVITSVLVACGTLFYAGAAAFQLWLMSQSGIHTDEQLGRVIDNVNWMARAMDGTAQSAKDSIAAAHEQMRLEHRAWIGPTQLNAGTFSKENGFPVIIVFINSGKTPAKSVEVASAYMMADSPKYGPTLDGIDKLRYKPAPDIAPQASLNEIPGAGRIDMPNVDAAQSEQEIIARFQYIYNQRIFLYYFGRIKYADVFGRQWTTDWCIYLDDPKNGRFSFCPQFNSIK